jgi:NADPH:quinone reductase-like Zn-dependent oxidoreductase
MAATYRAVMMTKKRVPDGLQVVELPIEDPGPGRLRVRVRAAGVGATDLMIFVRHLCVRVKIALRPGL